MTTELKPNAAPRPTTTGEQASKEVPYDEKNFSDKPFQHPEAYDKQGLPVLWPLSDAVLWSKDSGKAEGDSCAGLHKVSQKDREFYYSITLQYRIEARACLAYLIRFDDGIDMEGSRALMAAVQAIHRAEDKA
jgi:hypothetical protein